MSTLYRAAPESHRVGQHFAYDLACAVAYRHNDGFGGVQLYTATDDGLRVLDLREGHESYLASILGDDWMERYETAAWALEAHAVVSELRASGYDAVRYYDDYPNEADVLYVIDGLAMEPMALGVRAGLLMAVEDLPDWRAHSLHVAAAEWVAERVRDDEGDMRDQGELDSEQVVDLLRHGHCEDGDFVLTLVERDDD